MTAAIGLPPHVAALAPDARFIRIPSPHGDGVLLVAQSSGGVLAIAPPWTSLDTLGDEPPRIAWRYGWFPQHADGDADLDGPAREYGELTFDAIWHVRQLESHRTFLKACFAACATQLGRVARFRDTETRAAAIERLRSMRAEWTRVFPEEPFPAPLPPPAAPPRQSLGDMLREGFRVVLARAATGPEPVFLAGLDHLESEEPGRSVEVPFGQHAQLQPPSKPGQHAELVINFDGLAEVEAALADLRGSPVTIVLEDRSDNTVLARVDIDAAEGYLHQPVDINIEHLPSAIRLDVLAKSSL